MIVVVVGPDPAWHLHLQATNTSRIERAIAAEYVQYYRARKFELSSGTFFFALLFRAACEGGQTWYNRLLRYCTAKLACLCLPEQPHTVLPRRGHEDTSKRYI